MSSFSGKKLFWTILLVLIGMRLINITMPILEGTAMRQTQTAMIARNFFREGFNILYPKIDYFGNATGHLVLEFPLLNMLAAFGYILLGGVREWFGRLISILFFAGGASFLYAIVKRLFDKKTALCALTIFGILPLSIIYSRAFMPDFVMLFFSVGAVYFLLTFCDTDSYTQYWVSAVFLSMALLTKVQSFYILMPLVYLLYRKRGFKFIVDYKNWLYLIIALGPAILWYLHGNFVHTEYSKESAFNYQLANWFNPMELLNKHLYIDLLNIYSGILLTPIGLVLFIGGLLIKTKNKENLIWAWLCSVIIFLVAFITHIDDPYYNLSFLPIASIFIARMLVFLSSLNWSRTILLSAWGKVLLIILILPFWARYAGYAYVVPKGYRYIPEAGQEIQKISKRNELIIASAAAGSQALYFCDRKGWGFKLPGAGIDMTKKAIENLESLRKAGAVYFVATVMQDFDGSPSFKDYMQKNYQLIQFKEGKYIIFSLKK